MKKRIAELDFLKGIAIILVIIGHGVSQIYLTEPELYQQNVLFRFCYSFHMPLFVFISGIVASLTVKEEAVWLKKRFIRIGIPLAVFLVWHYVLIKRTAIGTFFSPMPYWYLFFVLIADTLYFIDRKFRLKMVPFGVILLISCGLYFKLGKKADIITQLVYYLPFYCAGTAALSVKERLEKKLTVIYGAAAVLYAVVFPFFRVSTEAQEELVKELFSLDSVSSLLLMIIFAADKYAVPVFGIGMMLFITRLIYRFKITEKLRRTAEFIGGHTLFIYLMHAEFFRNFTCEPLRDCIISCIAGLVIPLLVSVGYGDVKKMIRSAKNENPKIQK